MKKNRFLVAFRLFLSAVLVSLSASAAETFQFDTTSTLPHPFRPSVEKAGPIQATWSSGAVTVSNNAPTTLNFAVPGVKTVTLSAFDSLATITHLHLEGQQLTGTFGAITNFRGLRELRLARNALTGFTPVFDLPALEVFDLSKNQLSGNIPTFPLDCLSLRVYNVSSNQFTGITILLQHPALEVIDISHNRIQDPTGSLRFSDLPLVRVIRANDNQLTTYKRSEGTDLTTKLKLRELLLHNNRLPIGEVEKILNDLIANARSRPLEAPGCLVRLDGQLVASEYKAGPTTVLLADQLAAMGWDVTIDNGAGVYRAEPQAGDPTLINTNPDFTFSNQLPGTGELVIPNTSGFQAYAAFVENITAGSIPAENLSQEVHFEVRVDRPELFTPDSLPRITTETKPSSVPALATAALKPAVLTPTAALSFQGKPGAFGRATVTVVAKDTGPRGDGAENTSVEKTFFIRVDDVLKLANDTFAGTEDQVLTVDVLENDSGLGDGVTSVTVDQGIPGLESVVVLPNNRLEVTPLPDFHGIVEFSYQVLDGFGETASATVTITFAPVNDIPAAVEDALETNEDVALVNQKLLVNDQGLGDTPLTVTISSPASHGTPVVVVNNGQSDPKQRFGFTYTPQADFHGVDFFTYTVTDATGDQTSALVRVIVNSVNDIPGAVADSVTTPEDTPVLIPVLANDTGLGDTPLGPLELSNYTPDPFPGTLEVDSNLRVLFTPAADFYTSQSPLSFEYKVTDQDGQSAEATVSITVTAVNDPPTFQSLPNPVRVKKGETPHSIQWASAISVGPANETGSMQFMVTAVSPNQALQLFKIQPTINPSGLLQFTPLGGASGSTSFQVVLKDDGGTPQDSADDAQSAPRLLTIEITDAPSAHPVSAQANQETALAIVLDGSDPAGLPMTAKVLSLPANGRLYQFVTGSPQVTGAEITQSALPASVTDSSRRIVYVPNAGFNTAPPRQPETFQFSLSNGTLDSLPGTVTVAVNGKPAALPPALTSLSGTAPTGLTLRGSDPEGDALSFTITRQPYRGSLTPATGNVGDGTAANVTYTPDAAKVGLNDQFEFRVTDAHGLASEPIVVNLTLQAGVVTFEDCNGIQIVESGEADPYPASILIPQGAVRNRITGIKVEIAGLSHTFLSDVQMLLVGPGGKGVVLMGNAGFASIADGITLTFEEGAQPLPESESVASGTYRPTAYGIVDFPETGVAPGQIFTSLSVFNDLNPAGEWKLYVYDTLSGEEGVIECWRLHITAEHNFPPEITQIQNLTGTEDTQVGPVSFMISDREASPEALVLSFNDLSPSPVIASHTFGGSGTSRSLVLTPQLNAVPTNQSLRVTVTDPQGSSASTEFTLTLASVNDFPVASPDAYVTPQASELTIPLRQPGGGGLLDNDFDVDGDLITFRQLNGGLPGTPNGGTVRLNEARTAVIYTPRADLGGGSSDSFTYSISDGNRGVEATTVTITIGAIPTAVSQQVSAQEDTLQLITLAGGAPSQDATLVARVKQLPVRGVLYQYVTPAEEDLGTLEDNRGAEIGANGLVSDSQHRVIYLPGLNFNSAAMNPESNPPAAYGPDSFVFVMNDGSNDSFEAVVGIGVSAVNDAPAFELLEGDLFSVNEGSSGPIQVVNPGSVVFGPADESGQGVLAYEVSEVVDTAGILAGTPSVSQQGELNYSLVGHRHGVVTMKVALKDNGASEPPHQNRSADRVLTLSVQNVNDAPVLTVPAEQTISINNLLSVALEVSDPDANDPRIYGMRFVDAESQTVATPAGAALSQAGVFTWKPVEAQIGIYRVEFTVADRVEEAGRLSDTETLVINVVNVAENCEDIVILDNGPANPYPSQVTVAGYGNTLRNVKVTVRGLSHTFSSDVGILLESPDGKTVVLMDNVGGSSPVSGAVLVFDDAAPAGLPVSSAIGSGTYRPTQNGSGQFATFPAEHLHGTTLGSLAGINPNGVWKLYVVDRETGDTGVIDCWSLNVEAEGNTAPQFTSIEDQTTAEDVSKTVQLQVTDNENEAGLSYQVAAEPAGKLVLAADPQNPAAPYTQVNGESQELTLVPVANAFGQVTVTVTATDVDGMSSSRSFVLTITPVQDLPVAVDDQVTNTLGETLNIPITFLLANDFDVDGETVLFKGLQSAVTADGGSVTIQGAFIRYIPPQGQQLEDGPDSFIYIVTDGKGGTDVATVTIQITPLPSGQPQALEMLEDGLELITLTGTGGNIYSVVTFPAHGRLYQFITPNPDQPGLSDNLGAELNAENSVVTDPQKRVVYAPNANYHNTQQDLDAFQFTIRHNEAVSAPATITLLVGSLNDAPSFALLENGLFTVLEESTGPLQVVDALSISLGPPNEAGQMVSQYLVSGLEVPAGLLVGTPTVNLSGQLEYQLEENATGQFSLSIELEDNGDSGPGHQNRSAARTITVTVQNVNDAPKATPLSREQALQFSEGSAPLVIDNLLVLEDVDNTALIQAVVRFDSMQPEGPSTFAAGQDVLASPETATIAGMFNAQTGELTLSPKAPAASASLAEFQAALRTVTYQNTSQNPLAGTRRISIQVNDGGSENNLSVPAVRDLQVTAENQAPVVQFSSVATITYLENAHEAGLVIDPSANITDVDSAELASVTVEISSGFVASQDQLLFGGSTGIQGSFNAANGTLTLLPAQAGEGTPANFTAALRQVKYQNTSHNPSTQGRTLRVIAHDGQAASTPATRSLAVVAENDAPIAGADAVQAAENTSLQINRLTLTSNDSDPENNPNPPRFVGVTSPSAQGGSLTYNPSTGIITYQPKAHFSGTDTFHYTIRDNPGLTAMGTVTVTVAAKNVIPTVTLQNTPVIFRAEGVPVLLDDQLTLANDDPTGDDLLAKAEVTLQGAVEGEVLAIDEGSLGSLAASYLNGVLTVSGQGTVAEYQEALRTVTYHYTASEPTVFTRIIQVKVTDVPPPGTGTIAKSGEDTRQVRVIPNLFFQSQDLSTSPAGAGPFATAVADFNQDGLPDIAVINFLANQVSIHWAEEELAFTSTTDIQVGTAPFALVARDLDGDGHADLAVANSESDDVTLLFGNGDGTFHSMTLAAGFGPFGLAAADLNQDGILDLVVANRYGDSVTVLVAGSSRSYQPGVAYPVGAGPYSVAVGDFNGDGQPDIATANLDGASVSILPGTGSGSFGSAASIQLSGGPVHVAAGDLNGDGSADLVVADYDQSRMLLLLNNGAGVFASSELALAGPVHPRSFQLADLNGDGRLDLVVANQTAAYLSIFLGQGTGGFEPEELIDVTEEPNLGPSFLDVADLNGDGRLDILAPLFGEDRIQLLLQTAPPPPEPEPEP